MKDANWRLSMLSQLDQEIESGDFKQYRWPVRSHRSSFCVLINSIEALPRPIR